MNASRSNDMSFNDAVRAIGRSLNASESFEAALRYLASAGETPIETLSSDKRQSMIQHVTSRMKDMGITERSRVASHLMNELDAGPEDAREIALDSALSMVEVRNALAHLLTFQGYYWNQAMKIQAAVSAVLRKIREDKGGSFVCEAEGKGIRLEFIFGPGAGEVRLEANWLALLRSLDCRVSLSSTGGRTTVLCRLSAPLNLFD